METLIWFLIWGGLMFLMMRGGGCGSHMAGHRAGHGKGPSDDRSADQFLTSETGGAVSSPPAAELRWEAPKTDVDPVCGKTVTTAKARPSVHDGQVYYFCSRECREVFEVAPEQYVGRDDQKTEPPRLEQIAE